MLCDVVRQFSILNFDGKIFLQNDDRPHTQKD